jgi:hypothetical protein
MKTEGHKFAILPAILEPGFAAIMIKTSAIGRSGAPEPAF